MTSTGFEGRRVHILGVAGTLMGAFASFLKKSGVQVTGSDQNIYPPMSQVLAAAGIEVMAPFAAANLDRARPDLVIVGNVIRKTNPEMEAVVERGLPYQSLPAALEAMVLPGKHPVVVAGTHGKTTTSSMLAWILEKLGQNPSFFVGGVMRNFPESFRITSGRFMVLEGDEYDTAFFDKVPKFTHYRPQDAVLTSVEYDHADIYPDIGSVIAAFDKLAELTHPSGHLIACAETETTLRVAHHASANVLTYGFGAGVDSRATSVDLQPAGATFKWACQGEMAKVNLPVGGRHNVLNALACLTFVKARGLSTEEAVGALASYEGVKRRQEVFGQASGITLIDDFAHHPTAVRETLAAVRSRHPDSRLVACFEPRSATSRRKVFQQAYAESFDQADLVFVAKPYSPPSAAPAPAPGDDVFSTEHLLEDLGARGKRARMLQTSDAGLRAMARELKSGDVVLVMSNGGFDLLLPRLLAILSG